MPDHTLDWCFGKNATQGLERVVTAALPADIAESARKLVDTGKEEEAARRNLVAGKRGKKRRDGLCVRCA